MLLAPKYTDLPLCPFSSDFAKVLVTCPRECGVQCSRANLAEHLFRCTKEDPFAHIDSSQCLEFFNLKGVGVEVLEEWLQVVGFNHQQVRINLFLHFSS